MQFPIVEKLTIKSIRIWNKFKEWLKNNEITTIYNFKKIAESRLKMSTCKNYFKYKNEKGEIYTFEITDEIKPFRIMQE